MQVLAKHAILGTAITFILDHEMRVLFRLNGFGPGSEQILETEIREALELPPLLDGL